MKGKKERTRSGGDEEPVRLKKKRRGRGVRDKFESSPFRKPTRRIEARTKERDSLGSVGVLSGVSHGEQSSLGVLYVELFSVGSRKRGGKGRSGW